MEYKCILEKLNTVKNEIKDELHNVDVQDKIKSLESSLMKLIGLSSNSSKKGNFGENVLEDIFLSRYGDLNFERMSGVNHSGDGWLYINKKRVMVESKNYNSCVGKEEVNKLERDMISNNIRWGLMISFNSRIQGMKELDFHRFEHNNELYSVIMVSMLSSDYCKLDLGLGILRKLIDVLDVCVSVGNVKMDELSLLLCELNETLNRNYLLRDSYYNMERDMNKLMSNYHVILRDYQYEMDKKTKDILNKLSDNIYENMNEDNDICNNILEKNKGSKNFVVISRILDIVEKKGWVLKMYVKCKNEFLVKTGDDIDGKVHVKIQLKKVVVHIVSRDIVLSLNVGKEKENLENLNILLSL